MVVRQNGPPPHREQKIQIVLRLLEEDMARTVGLNTRAVHLLVVEGHSKMVQKATASYA